MSEEITLEDGDSAIIFKSDGKMQLIMPNQKDSDHLNDGAMCALLAIVVNNNSELRERAIEIAHTMRDDFLGKTN